MWEYLVAVIAAPVQALREVAEKKLWKQGLLLVAVLALLNAAVSLATANAVSPGVSDPEYTKLLANLYTPAVYLTFILMTTVLSWFLSGAIYYGFSKLFKGVGTLAGMLAGLGFAMTPYLLSVPLSALALLLGRTSASLVGGVAGFVAGLWILALNVLAIRESQQLGTGQAIGVILLTIAAFFVLIFIIGALIAIIVAIAALMSGSIPS